MMFLLMLFLLLSQELSRLPPVISCSVIDATVLNALAFAVTHGGQSHNLN